MFALKPNRSVSFYRQVGLFHVDACRGSSATQAIGDLVTPSLDVLKARGHALEDAAEAVALARGGLARADRVAEAAIRTLRDEAAILDRKDVTEQLVATLFVEGLTPAVRPTGERQLAALVALEQRLASLAPRPLVGQQGPALETARLGLAAAVARLAAARRALADARTAVQLAKDEVGRAIEASYGALVLLLRSKERARAFFPRPDGRDEADPEEAAPAPAAPLGASPPVTTGRVA